MRNLLFGVVLGLLAVVYTTPADAVTQIPTKAEDEVIGEGFLIDRPSLTTKPTVPNEAKPSASSSSTAAFTRPKFLVTYSRSEGSGEGFDKEMTFSTVRTTTKDTTTETAVTFVESEGSGMFTTESTTTPEPRIVLIRERMNHHERPVKTVVTFVESEGSGSGSGSGSATGEKSGITTEVSPIVQEPRLDTSKGRMFHGIGPIPTPEPQKGHNTPGWMIIVGFIVGVGALVMVCVAIATRDKWNRPPKDSVPEPKTNSNDQQREIEMETFLHKDQPRENGKEEEYTVIPLDELPENYSSH